MGGLAAALACPLQALALEDQADVRRPGGLPVRALRDDRPRRSGLGFLEEGAGGGARLGTVVAEFHAHRRLALRRARAGGWPPGPGELFARRGFRGALGC